MSENFIPRVRVVKSHESVVDLLKQNNPQICVEFARNGFASGRTRNLEFRRKQLLQLKKFLKENEEQMIEIVSKDLKKPKHETHLFELDFIKNDLHDVLSNLTNWTSPEVVHKKLIFIFDKAIIYNDPLGVVLIIGAWNYPFQACLLPLASCIAAGNCFILQPSPLTKHTTKFLADTLPQYLDEECYQVYLGPIKEILVERFDYIFYTGEPNLAHLVGKAAAVHKTPTTLILGGKNPVYLDESADIEIAARRIMWGKCVNSGQTCIGPEYVLCNKATENRFIKACEKVLKEFYNENPKESPDYGRIVNEELFDKLTKIINTHHVALGGVFDKKERYVSPTILVDVTVNSAVMEEEIYGPILPIVTVNNIYSAIKIMNSKDKPLAMYIFSKKQKDINLILDNTSSGGVTVNDTLMHIACDSLPFGGVGASGMGAYHGKRTFDSFVHKKSVFQRPQNALLEMIETIRYPPYHDLKIKGLKLLLAKNRSPSMKTLSYLFTFLVGVIVGLVIYYSSSLLNGK